jgi:hypothetical protein
MKLHKLIVTDDWGKLSYDVVIRKTLWIVSNLRGVYIKNSAKEFVRYDVTQTEVVRHVHDHGHEYDTFTTDYYIEQTILDGVYTARVYLSDIMEKHVVKIELSDFDGKYQNPEQS